MSVVELHAKEVELNAPNATLYYRINAEVLQTIVRNHFTNTTADR